MTKQLAESYLKREWPPVAKVAPAVSARTLSRIATGCEWLANAWPQIVVVAGMAAIIVLFAWEATGGWEG